MKMVLSLIVMTLIAAPAFAQAAGQVKVERSWKEMACQNMSRYGQVDLEFCIDNSAISISYLGHKNDQSYWSINYKGRYNRNSRIIEDCNGVVVASRTLQPVKIVENLVCKL